MFGSHNILDDQDHSSFTLKKAGIASSRIHTPTYLSSSFQIFIKTTPTLTAMGVGVLCTPSGQSDLDRMLITPSYSTQRWRLSWCPVHSRRNLDLRLRSKMRGEFPVMVSRRRKRRKQKKKRRRRRRGRLPWATVSHPVPTHHIVGQTGLCKFFPPTPHTHPNRHHPPPRSKWFGSALSVSLL